MNPRPGDLYRLPYLDLPVGKISANEDSDLLVLFLGTVDKDDQPNVTGALRTLGFSRTHVFEAYFRWQYATADQDADTLILTADTPQAAALAALHYGKSMEGELVQLGVRLCRLGGVSASGASETTYGQWFFRWSKDSGVSLEELEAQCSTSPKSAT